MRAFALLVVLSACSSRVSYVTSPGDALLAVLYPSDEIRVYRTRADEALELDGVLSNSDEQRTLEALILDPLEASQSELTIPERGELHPDPEGVPLGAVIGRRLRTVVSSDESVGWTETSSLASSVESFRVPLRERVVQGCHHLSSRAFALPSSAPIRGMSRFGDEGVDVFLVDGTLLRYPSLEPESAPISFDLQHAIYGGTTHGDTYWVVDGVGRVRRGEIGTATISSTIIRGSRIPLQNDTLDLTLVRMTTHLEPEPAVYFSTTAGDVGRLVGDSLEIIHSFGSEGATRIAGIAVGEGGVYASSASSAGIWDVSGERLVPTPSSAGISALGFVPSLGLVAGNADGQFFVLESAENRFRELGGSILTLLPYSIVSFADGFLLGGALGTLGQQTMDGYCPLTTAGPSTLHFVEELEREIVFATATSTRRPVELRIIPKP